MPLNWDLLYDEWMNESELMAEVGAELSESASGLISNSPACTEYLVYWTAFASTF